MNWIEQLHQNKVRSGKLDQTLFGLSHPAASYDWGDFDPYRIVQNEVQRLSNWLWLDPTKMKMLNQSVVVVDSKVFIIWDIKTHNEFTVLTEMQFVWQTLETNFAPFVIITNIFGQANNNMATFQVIMRSLLKQFTGPQI